MASRAFKRAASVNYRSRVARRQPQYGPRAVRRAHSLPFPHHAPRQSTTARRAARPARIHNVSATRRLLGITRKGKPTKLGPQKVVLIARKQPKSTVQTTLPHLRGRFGTGF